jgi:hypothetical protein
MDRTLSSTSLLPLLNSLFHSPSAVPTLLYYTMPCLSCLVCLLRILLTPFVLPSGFFSGCAGIFILFASFLSYSVYAIFVYLLNLLLALCYYITLPVFSLFFHVTHLACSSAMHCAAEQYVLLILRTCVCLSLTAYPGREPVFWYICTRQPVL